MSTLSQKMGTGSVEHRLNAKEDQSMTKKDYETIAKVLSTTSPIALSKTGIAQKAQWEYMRDALSKAFKHDNPRFLPVRFRDACEPK